MGEEEVERLARQLLFRKRKTVKSHCEMGSIPSSSLNLDQVRCQMICCSEYQTEDACRTNLDRTDGEVSTAVFEGKDLDKTTTAESVVDVIIPPRRRARILNYLCCIASDRPVLERRSDQLQ